MSGWRRCASGSASGSALDKWLFKARQQTSEAFADPQTLPCGFDAPDLRVHDLGRRLQLGADEIPILGIFVVEDLGAAAHVGAGQFVGRAVELAELELRLSQAQVDEGIAQAVRGGHGLLERVAGLVVGAEVVAAVADGGVDPGRQLPLTLVPKALRLGLCCGALVIGQALPRAVSAITAFP